MSLTYNLPIVKHADISSSAFVVAPWLLGSINMSCNMSTAIERPRLGIEPGCNSKFEAGSLSSCTPGEADQHRDVHPDDSLQRQREAAHADGLRAQLPHGHAGPVLQQGHLRRGLGGRKAGLQQPPLAGGALVL